MRQQPRSALSLLTLSLTLIAGLLAGCIKEQNVDTPTKTDAETTATASSDSVVEVDVPFASTRQPVVERMLEVADVSEDDVVYDLGSGDGRIVIAAADQYDARGVGIDIDPDLVREARKNAEEAEVTSQVEFRRKDMFEADFHDASVVTLYLLPSANRKLRPELFEQLEPGARVVSHDFDMGNWEPDTTVEMGRARIHLWTIPSDPPESLNQQ